MEFERSIYRMHEQTFRSRLCSKTLLLTAYLLAALTLLSCTNFFATHLCYLNRSSILKEALESQVLTDLMNSTNAHLPYSAEGGFNFCNLQTFEKTDTDSIKDYAVDQTSIHGGNITQE